MLAYCGYEVGGVLMRLISRRFLTRVTMRFPWMRGLRGVRRVDCVRDYTAGTNLEMTLDVEPSEESDSSTDEDSAGSSNVCDGRLVRQHCT